MTDATANAFTTKHMLKSTLYMTIISIVGLSIGAGFSTAAIWAAGRLTANIDMIIRVCTMSVLICFFLWLAFFYLVKTGWID